MDKRLSYDGDGKWKWKGRVSLGSTFDLTIEMCKDLGNDYLSHHLEYVLCHDQPCLAVLSPMAYDTMRLAIEASPQKKREITKALCEAPKTSVDQSIQQRLLAVLNGQKVKPPLCSACKTYPDYLELYGKL